MPTFFYTDLFFTDKVVYWRTLLYADYDFDISLRKVYADVINLDKFDLFSKLSKNFAQEKKICQKDLQYFLKIFFKKISSKLFSRHLGIN